MPGKENQGRKRPTTLGGRRGIALLAVLWVLTLLALMAASFMRTTRSETSLARNLIESAKAEGLADAGVELAVARLLQPVGGGGWILDDTVHELVLDDGEARVTIADEAGKIDLNGAREGLLQALFRAAGVDGVDSTALAHAIIDFRDPDSLRQLHGAEDDDYAEAGYSHGAKDSPFEIVEELQQVKGMTAALYAEVAPAFTVHSRRPLPNDRTAPPLVSAALAGRTGGDPEIDPATSGQTGAETAAAQSGAVARAAQRSRIATYSVHAEGRTAGGAVFARDAILRLRGNAGTPYLVLSWRQGRRVLFVDAEDEFKE